MRGCFAQAPSDAEAVVSSCVPGMSAAPLEWSAELAAQYGLPEGWFVRKTNKKTMFRNGSHGKPVTASDVEQELGYKPHPTPTVRLSVADSSWSDELASEYGLPRGWLAKRNSKATKWRNGPAGLICQTYAMVKQELGYLPDLEV